MLSGTRTATSTTRPSKIEPGSKVVIRKGSEPPDFDEIARTDGGVRGCTAWVMWNKTADWHDVDIGLTQDELFDALAEIDNCSTVGYRNYELYRQCVSEVELTKVTEEFGDSSFVRVYYVLPDVEHERCLVEAVSAK